MSFLQWFGVILLLDDAADIGRFDRIHHWMIGAVLLLFGE